MARDGAIYVCQACGAVHGKWSGQCGACGQWNTIVEESRSAPPGALKPASSSRARGVQFESLQSDRAVCIAYGVVTIANDGLSLGATVIYSADLVRAPDGLWRFSRLLIGMDGYAGQKPPADGRN
jgi:DNA repair protein RadA/Sms